MIAQIPAAPLAKNVRTEVDRIVLQVRPGGAVGQTISGGTKYA